MLVKLNNVFVGKGVKGRERSRWSGCAGCMAEGAVYQGQGSLQHSGSWC